MAAPEEQAAVPQTQFATISEKGFQGYWATPSVVKHEGLVDPDGEFFQYSAVTVFLRLPY
tara:strand:+ start:590 stop:769 length:180 start_codon:yes stop_codon:yes gene_type:complete